MTHLVLNEWRKLRREKGLWFALALHLAPWAMVTIAALIGATATGPSRYFILHNQSMLVTGLVACVVTSIAFHVELGNRTWFDWLTQPQGATRLVTAKLLSIATILASFVALSTVLMIVLMLSSGARTEIWRMTIAYLTLQCGTFAVMVALSAVLCVLTRNVVIVNIMGVGVGMATMVVMGADFSWALPTAWPYRLGLTLLDDGYDFPWNGSLPSGAAIYAACTVLALLIAASFARRPNVINAPMR
ncbi:ABC transporter permease [Brevibacterium sp. SMBL_HHYL_HB1]|uniref:ABC transporter permease n=1 Tax=Brevibacterium sp. SMBL_HHYL_HB1 TaxID=2777556 RepID=UPI001BA4A808|nr:ABC transporter permease [Brevibacterium sp. SMBL_HHYL_HB1]QUL78743.1 ABC transporter permease [Brevibacterium sp. SMBL_HHYL_HB1]